MYSINLSRLKILTLSSVSSLFILATAAQAGPFSKMLNALDKNKDQAISFSEMKATVDPFFTKADTNKDGFISPKEHAQAVKKLEAKEKARRMREFKRQDKNKDGKVSRKEMHKHLYTFFQFMDSSKDGKITIGEMRIQGVKAMMDSRFN